MTKLKFNGILEDLEDTKRAYEGLAFLIGIADLDGSSEISHLIEKVNLSLKLNIDELESLNNPHKKLEIIK